MSHHPGFRSLLLATCLYLASCGGDSKEGQSNVGWTPKAGSVLAEMQSSLDGTRRQWKLVYQAPYQLTKRICTPEGCSDEPNPHTYSKSQVDELVRHIQTALAAPSTYRTAGPSNCQAGTMRVTIADRSRVLIDVKYCDQGPANERHLSGAPATLMQWAQAN